LTGIFPDCLKFLIIKPIYKKADKMNPKMNPTNYRTVSLLTSFLKVFENPWSVRLAEHFCSNKLLVGNQSGFRKGIATKDAIFKLTNKILNALNNKTMAGSIFCNLEKAFNSVNHDLLLPKPPYYGISGKTKLLLESYHQNRYQKVQIINLYLNSSSLKMDQNKIWGATEFSFGPIVISSIHQ